jgi:N-acetylglutamate synthase-like GNAT family acetyltransferase
VEQRPEPQCCEDVLVMGVATLYLFTCDRQGFYKRLGWSELEEAKYAGRLGTIMRRNLAA